VKDPLARLIGIGLVGWVLAAAALDDYGLRSLPAERAELIVVAGCRVEPDGTPSPCLRARVEAAVGLWREGRAPALLMTGGHGENPPTEAEAARMLATSLGVPGEQILIEDRSTSTEENARFARERTAASRLIVVTDGFHVLRTSRVFGRYFGEVSALGVRSPWPLRVRGALREVPALLWYAGRGRLVGREAARAAISGAEVGMSTGEGYWVGRGAPSAVDWCEPNYAVTPYVAEFWNTVTSVPLLLLGLYGLWQCARSSVARERRFAWSFIGLAAVGAGSVAFHGTLLRTAQALDELPMVYLGLIGAWVVRYRGGDSDEGRSAAMLLGGYAVAFTAAYLWIAEYFALFIATYALLVGYVVVRSVNLTWLVDSPPLMRQLLAISAGGYLGTLFFCWVPEHVLLSCSHPLQAWHLHGWWHLGAGIGTYTWFLWAIVDRRQLEGVATRLAPWLALALHEEDGSAEGPR
jgi:dihydroceramidase